MIIRQAVELDVVTVHNGDLEMIVEFPNRSPVADVEETLLDWRAIWTTTTFFHVVRSAYQPAGGGQSRPGTV